MLDTLGKLHVNGVLINFKEFHRYHPKEKVQLPFYPFQRKQFWMPMLNFVVSKKQFHPLLGLKLELPKSPNLQETQTTKQSRFQNLVTIRSHVYIGDHKVGRHALMPAAGFIELFLAAASTSSATEFPIILENVVIKSPFVVDEVIPRELHTVLTLSAENDKTTTAKMIAFGRKVG
jgi:phthiocerol/phenolphthiocerol synthesis type-I polyketide synthase D